MNYKNIFLMLTLLFISSGLEANDFIKRAAPVDPVLISKDFYQTLKMVMPPLSSLVGSVQKNDEWVLRHLQATRTDKDCKEAQREVDISLTSLFGKELSAKEIENISTLLNQVSADSYYFSTKLKKDFFRDRPFVYMSDISPCVKKEVTAAYPSGHASLSRLEALVLGDLFPNRMEHFNKRSLEIGHHRVLAGVHHPSDIEAGRIVADSLFEEFKKSKSYQTEFSRVKKLLQEK
jgi:acid phosphatase (class A)